MDKKVYEYISQQTKDPIVERKICTVSGKEFAVFQSDLNFYNKISPTFDSVKFPIPTPTLCPEERQRRRLAWRNERKLYKRKCDFSWNDIISIYSPDKPHTVYQQKHRRSDNRDPLSYGKDFDYSQSFFPQFNELLENVPAIAIMNDDGLWTSENCSYCQDFAFWKNCYMVTATWLSENCMYADCCLQVKDCVDCIMVNNNSHNVYEWSYCTNIQNCSYISNSTDSHDCHFCESINGCSFCFGCVGLNNKQYYIFNEQYDQASYKNKVQELLKLGQDVVLNMFIEHSKKYPKESCIHRQSHNSSGNNIFSSSHITIGFDVVDVESAKYVTRLNSHAKDCYDIHQSWSPVLTYEWLTPDKAYHCAFVTRCREHCKNLYYCDNCHSCEDCFGCVWLRNKQYCIFNKQYTKETYQAEVRKILSHMIQTKERWEFFPTQLSPFGYNETAAQDYMPMTQEQAINRWYKRQEQTFDTVLWSSDSIIQWSVLSRNIEDISDDIIQKIILCEISQRPFRIIKQELEFYRKNNIPVPSRHPDIRHQERIQKLPPRTLYLRHCDKTGKEMLSCYPPNTPFQVYSQEAYEKEIHG